jgi:hypothetical protein
MKIYKSLKKVPATKAFEAIITAYPVSTTSGFESRTPFIVHTADDVEGIAVGTVASLQSLMSDQTEGQTDDEWAFVEPDNDITPHYASSCMLAGYIVNIVIEPVISYMDVHLNRKDGSTAHKMGEEFNVDVD